jgi:murein DD-endopeptidase MepM/ murein hydrolase activator NlpD
MRQSVALLLALCLLPALALAGTAKAPGKGAAAGSSKPVARPGPVLECPDSVGLGEPFLVRLRSVRPLAGVSLTWLQRQMRVAGRMAPGQAGGWEALVLLGSDVGNSAVGRHDLVVRAGGKGGLVLRRTVRVRAVTRPVESLTLDPAMVTPPESAHARISSERALVQGLLLGVLSLPVPEGQDTRKWTLPLARPVPGAVSSGYGIGRILNGQPHAPHRGLDLEAETGQPVLAAADAVVLFSGELYYAGNAVYLDHGQGLVTSYFHLSERSVDTGGRVARGQVVGLAGDTGRSTRSHLHFGVWALGRLVDPEPLFLYDPLP